MKRKNRDTKIGMRLHLIKKNIIKFITETRSKKAYPVPITPVTRMRVDAQGNVMETHKEYTAAVWKVGRTYITPVIDLDSMSRNVLQKLASKIPTGRKDATHFNEYGARRMAELVLQKCGDKN